MIYYYLVAISVSLLVYILYLQVCTLSWDENERRRLELIELRLAHILSLLDAPDMRFLLEEPSTRRKLFLDISDSLEKDVSELVRIRALSVKSVAAVMLFYVCLYSLRAKSYLICGRNDLRFLSRLELVVVRALD